MFDAGLSLFEVQQRLGHKSLTLAAGVYTHLMRERFEEGREPARGVHAPAASGS
jgi:integrase